MGTATGRRRIFSSSSFQFNLFGFFSLSFSSSVFTFTFWRDWASALGRAHHDGHRSRQAEDLWRRLLLVLLKPPTCLHCGHRAQLYIVLVAVARLQTIARIFFFKSLMNHNLPCKRLKIKRKDSQFEMQIWPPITSNKLGYTSGSNEDTELLRA